jgi:8-oxo-dGTP pyrophosphatase MutT (NUDIX family)
MKTKIDGAGIICYFDNRNGKIKKFSKDLLYLVLEDFSMKYDLTKGTIDKGESIIDCAIRETFEESNLDSFSFVKVFNPIQSNDNLIMYLGELKIEILENPRKFIELKVNKTINSPEHKSYKFLSFEEIISSSDIKLYNYLVPYIKEAHKILS